MAPAAQPFSQRAHRGCHTPSRSHVGGLRLALQSARAAEYVSPSPLRAGRHGCDGQVSRLTARAFAVSGRRPEKRRHRHQIRLSEDCRQAIRRALNLSLPPVLLSHVAAPLRGHQK